ncbi:MAG: sensor histidine kinase [Cyclobacteriaceae bacterium]
MVKKVKNAWISSRELWFQLLLHCLVFSFFVFDNRHPNIHFKLEAYQFVFFLNYTAANAIISYLLLPNYFYQKKYAQFFSFTLLIVGGVILIEELFIEKIYFPDSRGASFPGVLFSLGQVLPIIVILSGFKFAWDALTKQRELDELRTMIKESELQFLKSQINPHFLFNNLNNLYAYAIENSPKTPAIILELSSVLRYMLYDCREKYVSLAKEIEHLKNFTQLSELQIEERGTVQFSTHHLQPDYLIAPLILVVFVENAFKHSQASQASNIKIEIEISLSNEGELSFYCANNFHEEINIQDDSRGIGLENVRKRLQLLYPKAHQLSIEQKAGYYEVRLSMQLKKTTVYELHHH